MTCVQKGREICGLGCVNRAHARALVTQSSPHICLHIYINTYNEKGDTECENRNWRHVGDLFDFKTVTDLPSEFASPFYL